MSWTRIGRSLSYYLVSCRRISCTPIRCQQPRLTERISSYQDGPGPDGTGSRNAEYSSGWMGYFAFAAGIAGGALLLSQRENIVRSLRLPTVSAAARSDDGSNGVSNRHRFNFIAKVAREVSPTVVRVEILAAGHSIFGGDSPIQSNGSGFIVDSSGVILTNAHVVMSARSPNSIRVRLSDDRVFAASVDAVDANSDLATLTIPCDGLPCLPLGDSNDLQMGEWVVAMGSPLGLTNTVTAGVVSSQHRQCQDLGLHNKQMEYIQTDATITFGNSGGPLVNMDGEAIGVNTMKLTSGISFAVPINYVKSFLVTAGEKRRQRRQKTGNRVASPPIPRRYLGVTMLTLTPSIVNDLVLRQPDFPADISHGVLVYRVQVGSPAWRAGIRPGDVITHLDGQRPIHSANDIYDALGGGGQQMRLTVRRGQKKEILTAHPESIVQ